MLDMHAVRQDPEKLRSSQVRRGADPAQVDELLALDAAWRTATADLSAARATANAAAKAVGLARKDPLAKEDALQEARTAAAAAKESETKEAAAKEALDTLLRRLPNIVEDDVVPGGEEDFLLLDVKGDIPHFDFTPKDHVELGRLLGAIDLERGARTSGSRFYYLTGFGARLERALINLAMDVADEEGFTPVVPPVLVKPEAMEGTGFLGEHADEVYRLEADDLYLVGTSEVPLAAYHAGEIVDLAPGQPLRYAALSSCFRREAGSHGRDTRGIIRVHQFEKVEMFTFIRPEEAEAEHRRLLTIERRLLEALELPYRVIDVAAGDLGSSAARKFDCEAWIPTQGRYREVTSTSNCTTFQARRLKVRYRDEEGRTQVAATLNGTLAAVPRLIVALLENHQDVDGSVRIPAALQPYLGGITAVSPK